MLSLFVTTSLISVNQDNKQKVWDFVQEVANNELISISGMEKGKFWNNF